MAGTDKELLYDFCRWQRLAVLATASLDGIPQAALVHIATTPELEILFETTDATRKFSNLIHNPRAEMVIGWESNRTLQCRGLVDLLRGEEGERLKAVYLSIFPGHLPHRDWPGNHYFRLRLNWACFSDYNRPRKILEFTFPCSSAL